ncbi:AlbA family DNA-binding domain-containing protein [Planktosalinus lacus]|uniref:Schlafen AlbA-2 domain-containing protein n=1 Tax=Planktosalinus lacus TaxID=1526573 RepID=A0A8J2VDS5_9FLAO|nr:ATP-binding protein [Planktosalinus lacus]GGD99559.1 hypothetical protein GCM10011312_23760 [Planktosalinus lacus]
MKNPPFFYKVSFHFLAQDQNNELKHHSWQKEFHNSNPFEARKEAFEAFDDYLNNLEVNGRIEIDNYGNPKIISPTTVPEKPDFSEKLDSEDVTEMRDYIQKSTSYLLEFVETLDVLLIIEDDNLVDEIGYGDSTLAIHSISSHSFSKQEILDNLSREVDLYEKCNYHPFDHTVVIQHFGEDYAESGEEEGAENYAILPTPFKWITKEQYEECKEENEPVSELSEQNLWENIIDRGESNTLEFKSSLIYNFIPGSPNYVPRFNNAKTICGFLNSNGGILIIGISDDGKPQGIDKDLEFLGSKDKIKLEVDNMLPNYFSNSISSLIETSFVKIQERELLIIRVKPSSSPIFLKNYNPVANKTSKHFFVRRSASTTEIKDVEEIINYVFNHWNKN